VRRRVLALARVQRLGGPPLALRLEKFPHLARRRGDHEPAGRRGQQGLGPIVDPPGELDEAMADERCFADQEVLGLAMARRPLGQGVADPETSGAPDHRVSHAVGQRISPPRRDHLEHRARHVPLQEVDLPSGALRHVHELMGEKTLAGAGEPHEEDHAVCGQRADAFGEPAIRVHHDAGAARGAHGTG